MLYNKKTDPHQTKFRSFKLQNTFVLAVHSGWRPYIPNRQINLKKCTFLKQSFSIIHTIIKTANRFPVDLRFEHCWSSAWLLAYGCYMVARVFMGGCLMFQVKTDDTQISVIFWCLDMTRVFPSMLNYGVFFSTRFIIFQVKISSIT